MTYSKHEQAALEDCRERLAKSFEEDGGTFEASRLRDGRYDYDETIPVMMQLRRDVSDAIKAGGDALEAFVIPEPLTVDEQITQLAKERLVEHYPDYRKSIMANKWPEAVSDREAAIRAGMELAEKLREEK